MNLTSLPDGSPLPKWNPALAPVASPPAGTPPPDGDTLALSEAAGGGGPAASSTQGSAQASSGHVGILAAIGSFLGGLWHGVLHLLGLDNGPTAKSTSATAPAPAPTPAKSTPAPAPKPSAPPRPATYTVKPGDSLWAIAKAQLGDGNRWPEIFALNKDQISNPDLIYPGQVLELPPGASGAPDPTPAPAAVGNQAEPWTPGAGTLQGSDTSGWQSDAQFQQAIQGTQWAVIKASEGTGYTDGPFQARWAELGQKIADGSMKLRMAYVFLDPGNGTGQADHFLDVVGIHGPLPAGTRLVIDWEGAALGDPATLRDAANRIHQVTGLWPVIYVQGSEVDVARSTVPDAPIWEAAWSSHDPGNVPFWQYSDGPGYDHDLFNGDSQALAKFAGEA